MEDETYDLDTDGLFYFDTTGRSQFLNSATNKPYDAKGRLHAMQLDTNDPTKVQSLKVLLEGDTGDDILNPDNLSTSDNSVMIQEDINDEFHGIRAGRVSLYDLHKGTVTPVAELTHKDFNGNTIIGDKLGDWESSGIINMSDILGPNKWLLDVQPHSSKKSSDP